MNCKHIYLDFILHNNIVYYMNVLFTFNIFYILQNETRILKKVLNFGNA